MDDDAPDRAIVEASVGGDREALRLLFERHGSRVRSIALHFFAGDEAAADDMVQQVFLRLHGRLVQYRGHAQLATWLHRLVVNACLDDRRARRRLVSLEAADDAGTPGRIDDDVDRARRESRVRAAVMALPPKLRIAVLLRHFEELSYGEMADALGCSEGTVASRLNRGHAALAASLRPLVQPEARP